MTSKKRRKAREWMQHEASRRHAEIVKHESTRREFDRYRRDVTELYADRRNERYNGRESRVVSTIASFPDPRVSGPVAHYCLPFIPTPRFAAWDIDRMLSETDHRIRFRAIEFAVDRRVGDARSTLRWFQWEPEVGTPETEARTRVFRESITKLHRAKHELQLLTIRHSPELMGLGIVTTILVTISAIEELSDDLRRVMGRFRVDGETTSRFRERAQ